MPYRKRRRSMRTYARKYTRKYRRRRRRRWRLPFERSSPEVKYFDWYLNGTKSINTDFNANNDLSSVNNVLPNILDGISEGTGGANRIGRKIYVKRITIYGTMWNCGNTYVSGSTTYQLNVNSSLVRVIVHDSRSSISQNSTNFFTAAVATRDRITDFLARRNYKVFYDRVISISSGWHNSSNVDQNATTTGLIKRVRISIPIFRNVEFTSNGIVRDDADVYSLSATSILPNWDIASGGSYAIHNKPIVCSNWRARIYFTDA